MKKLIFIGVSLFTSLVLAGFLISNFMGSQKNFGPGTELDWRQLAELDFVTGAAPESLKKLNDKPVRIPGFMVPLEDSPREVKEFLLVPSPQACIHVPPPPPNQMIFVTFEGGATTPPQFGPIWVEGTLKLVSKKHMYGEASFELVAKAVQPYH